MNINQKSCERYFKMLLKLAPLAVLLIMLYTKTTTITEFTAILPQFSFSNTLVTYLASIGITLGEFGALAVGYANYIIMFHLIDIVLQIFLFLPHLFENFAEKLKGGGY